MLKLLEKYCGIASASGSEENLRNEIINDIKAFATDYYVDNLGNLVVFKKGKNRSVKKVMLDAHTDEIGFIITGYDGCYLRFQNLGGIDEKVLFGKRVKIGSINGVIGGCAVHLLDADERKKVQSVDNLRIDIGVKNEAELRQKVKIGDTAVFETAFYNMGEKIAARGIDDKIGCAVLVKLIQSELLYDTYFSFSVQEEIGCRGATVSAYSINPDCAITVEATTAADLFGVPEDKTVCVQGKGAALSLMDNGTLYDKTLIQKTLEIASENGINAQLKTAVAGGTNASVIHKTRNGIKTINIALPCRYIHSAYGVAQTSDILSVFELVKIMTQKLANVEV